MSPQASGSNSRIIYDEESSFGITPAVPDATILPFVTEGLGEKRNLIKTNVIRATRNPSKATRGNVDVSGNINTELNPFLGLFYKHLLGTVATSGSGPYVHTFKIDSLPTSLCLEKGFTDINQYFLYNGCRINKGSFEFDSEGNIPFNMDFIGKTRTVSGGSFDATPTDSGHLPFDGFEATIEEGGSALGIATNITLDIENDLESGVYVIDGTGERYAIPEGATLISGTLRALFEDMTLYNKAINFNESSLKILLSRGDGLGTTGNESLEFFIPELVYEANDPLVTGAKGVFIDMPFAGYYDNSVNATAAQVILKNSIATY